MLANCGSDDRDDYGSRGLFGLRQLCADSTILLVFRTDWEVDFSPNCLPFRLSGLDYSRYGPHVDLRQTGWDAPPNVIVRPGSKLLVIEVRKPSGGSRRHANQHSPNKHDCNAGFSAILRQLSVNSGSDGIPRTTQSSP